MFKKKWFIYYEYENDHQELKETSSPYFDSKKEALQYLSDIAKEQTVTKSILLTEGKNGVVRKRNENSLWFSFIAVIFFIAMILRVLQKVLLHFH